MSLAHWSAAGWLQPHKTSPAEVRDLWQIVDRDLADAASGGISADWQYGIAYNAALKLCTILLYAEGWKPAKGALAHSRTLGALPHILGATRQGDADYLEGCRQKRNTVEYDYAGGATKQDAEELIAFGHELRAGVLAWLKKKHPVLMPE
ncbi:hypothetical protein K0B96_16870 [Horticoccus luteus]|uniref:HEPN domain-containing protein n=1 Tax=Horticoccus luteus TaxID=2862869 RepID=A0A8F9XLE7_9BACT|nr:hypothetical protein [Horticoccus luteus]QYM78954.1 hypothetical protein K0B96_16870 [Horticoccus luteus]